MVQYQRMPPTMTVQSAIGTFCHATSFVVSSVRTVAVLLAIRRNCHAPLGDRTATLRPANPWPIVEKVAPVAVTVLLVALVTVAETVLPAGAPSLVCANIS